MVCIMDGIFEGCAYNDTRHRAQADIRLFLIHHVAYLAIV